jgi:hypothetical protein
MFQAVLTAQQKAAEVTSTHCRRGRSRRSPCVRASEGGFGVRQRTTTTTSSDAIPRPTAFDARMRT